MEVTSGSPRPSQSYPARLFVVQENLIFIGGTALFSLAAASPLPLVGAIAAELLWLGVGSSSQGVRRWLDRRDASLRRLESDRAVTSSIQSLDTEYARRVLTLDRALADVRDFGGRRPSPTFERAMARLESLRPVYLGLCEGHQRIARFLGVTTDQELALEADRLRATFAAEKDLGVRLTLRQAIGLAQRRLEHRQGMAQTLRGVGVKLESIERSVAYLRSQGLSLTSNPGLLDEVEALLSEIGPAVTVDVEPGEAPGLAHA